MIDCFLVLLWVSLSWNPPIETLCEHCPVRFLKYNSSRVTHRQELTLYGRQKCDEINVMWELFLLELT